MKYFEVEEFKLRGNTEIHRVCSDGSYCSDGVIIDSEAEALLWYRVTEFEENGEIINVIDYQINGADCEETLEKIKEDHQPDMWQNHDW